MQEYIKLPSKKNQIYLNREAVPQEIIKIFKEQESFERELYLYTLLNKSGLAPQIRSAHLLSAIPKSKTITLSYIEGETLLDALETAELKLDYTKAKQLLMQLIKWLQIFDRELRSSLTVVDLAMLGIEQEVIYNEQIISLSDLNFRNFIIHNNQLYGLDFEQVELTDSLTQYATLLAYMLTYNPIASSFKVELLEQVIMQLAQEQMINQEQLLAEIAEQIQIINERRFNVHRR